MAQISIEIISKETSGTASLDIVFIHGLSGDSKQSWTSSAKDFWPQWIADDFPDTRVALLGYPSSFFNNSSQGADLDFHSRAKAVLEFFINSGFGKKPTIFICHSLGGLIFQEMLRLSKDAVNDDWKCLADNIKGVVLLGVPNSGSALANILKAVPVSSKLLKAVSEDNSYLSALSEWFRNFATITGCKVKPYSEGKSTKGLMLVDKQSADPCVHKCPVVETDEDHLTISKLSNKGQPIYLGVAVLVRQLTGELPPSSSSIDNLENELAEEQLKKYSQKVDRPSLATKLRQGGREYQTKMALRKKGDFSKAISRSGLSGTSKAVYSELCGDVETKFNRHIMPLIHQGLKPDDVNRAVQEHVVDPILKKFVDKVPPVQEALIDEAIYFLTGQCFIKWHTNG